MNLRRTWTLLFAAALLAAAPGASAKPGYFVIPAYHSVELNLKGTHGYQVNIAKEGRDILLSAYKGPSTVIYGVPSLAPRGSEIKARLPGLGRISVRFHPLGPASKTKPDPFLGCKGGETERQSGYFTGTIRFRGERGYTRVRAKRARGLITTESKEVCKRFDQSPDSTEHNTELWAVSESGNEGVAFSASTGVIPGLTTWTSFSAMAAERRRGMGVFRYVSVSGGKRHFVAGDTRPFPLSGTVAPPAPFRGSGEFQRDAEGNSTWTGSLTAPLPGLGRVPLTGPEFTARFCQHPGCTGNFIDGHSLPLRQLRALGAVE